MGFCSANPRVVSGTATSCLKAMRRAMTGVAMTWVVVACLLMTGLAQTASAQQPVARAIITKIIPAYPELARSMRLDGAVKLSVNVSPKGTVKSLHALGGNPVLLKAAQDAVTQWKWAPAAQETTEVIELSFHPGQ
jgi:TonB family protein